MPKNLWSIEIESPRDRVWNTLTAPGEIHRFYFHSLFDADIRPGGKFRYATANGKRTFIRGEILEVVPQSRLAYRFRFTDIAEPEQRVTYELSDVDGGTRVTVRHDDLDAAPKHAKRVLRGWDHILGNLKHLLERGKLSLGTRVQYRIMRMLVLLMPKEADSV